MFIGGGRQNTVRRNLFINCTVPVHVDDRGLTWMKCKQPLANRSVPIRASGILLRFGPCYALLFYQTHYDQLIIIASIRSSRIARRPSVLCGHSHAFRPGIGGKNESYPKEFLSELDKMHYTQPPWSTEFPDIDVTSTPCAPALNVVRDNRYCFLPPPPPPPHDECAKCPGSHPYPYGGPVSGAWCCTVPVTPGQGCVSRKICCLTPGSQKNSSWGDDGCEGIARCGTNPTNQTACTAPPAPPAFTDYTR